MQEMRTDKVKVISDEQMPTTAKLTQHKKYVFFKGSWNANEKYFYVGIGSIGRIKRFREALRILFQSKRKKAQWIKVDLSLMGNVMDTQWLILFLNKQLLMKANLPQYSMDNESTDPIHSLDGR